MAVYTYVITPATGSAVTLESNTSSDETGKGQRMAEYSFPGINGHEVIVLGDTPRMLMLTAWLHAASESALRTAMDALEALQGKLCTLSVRGSEDSWTNCVLDGPPAFTERYPPQADSSVGCKVQLRIRQIIPA